MESLGSWHLEAGLKTPGDGVIGLVCGILNLFFFGVGTIIAAILDDLNVANLIIGILQLVLPFVGWIWSIIWGVLMIIRNL